MTVLHASIKVIAESSLLETENDVLKDVSTAFDYTIGVSARIWKDLVREGTLSTSYLSA